MTRPTIRDIAKAAGVSPGAASFALNDRAGVSEETRLRVKRIAHELGWTRNAAAVALSSGQARAVGLVIGRREETFTGERFFMRLIAGIERVLTERSLNLVLRLVDSVEDEMDSYQQWWAERCVDGVIVTDPRMNDPRPALLNELGLPGVFVGAQRITSLPRVRVDDGVAMRRLVDHFADNGHTRLAHVPGSADLVHTRSRIETFASHCRELGIAVVPVTGTDFREETGRAATVDLLRSSTPPSGIIYDSEVLTMGGLLAIAETTLRIPDDLAIASFEDSPICRISRPQITALSRDPAQLGADAAGLLLALLEGQDLDEVVEPAMELEIRGSTVPGLP